MRWAGWTLGSIFLASASLKIAQGNVGQIGFLQGTVLSLGEFFLAVWLFSGVRQRWSLRVAAAVFFCFAMTALWMVARGADDCGCFGPIRLSPKITYWIDLIALSVSVTAQRPVSFRRLFLILLTPGIALYIGILAVASQRGDDWKIQIGQQWPPSGVVECSANLLQGRWIILIYGSECARCESLASDYARDASEWAAQGKRTRLALLDADAHGGLESASTFPGVVRGDLLRPDLYKHAPILVLLDQGRVLEVLEDWKAVDWSTPPYSSWPR